MDTPKRVALTTAIAAAGVTVGFAIAAGLQEPLNALVWQLAYLLPSSLVGVALLLLHGIFITGYVSLLGYGIAKVWAKRR